MITFFIQSLSALTADHLGYTWLIAGILIMLLEIGTPGLFFFLSLACGTFLAALGAFLDLSLFSQCWLVVIGSVLSFMLLKSVIANKKKTAPKTNVDALIGEEALVIQTIEPRGTGRVKVKGEEWPAVADQHTILQKGTLVHIVRIDGNKLLVK